MRTVKQLATGFDAAEDIGQFIAAMTPEEVRLVLRVAPAVDIIWRILIDDTLNAIDRERESYTVTAVVKSWEETEIPEVEHDD